MTDESLPDPAWPVAQLRAELAGWARVEHGVAEVRLAPLPGAEPALYLVFSLSAHTHADGTLLQQRVVRADEFPPHPLMRLGYEMAVWYGLAQGIRWASGRSAWE